MNYSSDLKNFANPPPSASDFFVRKMKGEKNQNQTNMRSVWKTQMYGNKEAPSEKKSSQCASSNFQRHLTFVHCAATKPFLFIHDLSMKTAAIFFLSASRVSSTSKDYFCCCCNLDGFMDNFLKKIIFIFSSLYVGRK